MLKITWHEEGTNAVTDERIYIPFSKTVRSYAEAMEYHKHLLRKGAINIHIEKESAND